jgi:hypothetical protein
MTPPSKGKRMAVVRRFGSSSRRRRDNPFETESYLNRVDAFCIEYKKTNPGSSGNWITLPNGKKFRESTTLDKFTSRLELGSPQNLSGKWTGPTHKGSIGYSRETPGGVLVDDILQNGVAQGLLKGQSISSATSSPIIPPLMRNEAVTKALLDMADSKAGLGEDLATLSQIMKLIKNPMGTILNEMKRMRDTGNFRKYMWHTGKSLQRAGLVDPIAKQYLTYVYGWKPLMQDIFGIIEMAKEKGSNPLLLHSRATARSQSGLKSGFYNNITWGARTTLTSGTEDVRVNTSLWARVDPQYAALRALNQLGLLNPLSLAWELVSWSFVIDWIVPIGPVLQAFTAPAGLIFVDGTTSVRSKAQAQLTHHNYSFVSGHSLDESQYGEATLHYDGYTRSVHRTWPMPKFWFDSDPLRLKSDKSDRGFKALALAAIALPSFR